MDLTTAMFPIYMVWRLQMKRSTKWGLSFLMCGGILCVLIDMDPKSIDLLMSCSAAAATLVKVYYMRDLAMLSDVTYAWAPISLWYM